MSKNQDTLIEQSQHISNLRCSYITSVNNQSDY